MPYGRHVPGCDGVTVTLPGELLRRAVDSYFDVPVAFLRGAVLVASYLGSYQGPGDTGGDSAAFRR